MPTLEQRVKRWGNSKGILLTNDYCDDQGISVGDIVVIEYGIAGKKPTIEPKNSYTIDALLAGYSGEPPAEIDAPVSAIGKELW